MTSTISYSNMKSMGLINSMIVHPKYDKIMPLRQVCKFFFGTYELPTTTCIKKLLLDKIVFNYKDNPYLILSKLNIFIDRIGNLENQKDDYLLFNYYKFLGLELPEFQKKILEFNNNFIKYLEKEKPLFYVQIIEMIGKDNFNGQLITKKPTINIVPIYPIKYNGMFVINYGYDSLDMQNYVNLNINNNYLELYNYIKDYYLKMDIDRFVIYNLTVITRNEHFSTLLTESHNRKEIHCIPISLMNDIIYFKNDITKSYYFDKIKKKYDEGSLWKNIDGEPHFNFEGFNKYFLNLEEEDLESPDMKEIITDFYYNITNELINSYKSLYVFLNK